MTAPGLFTTLEPNTPRMQAILCCCGFGPLGAGLLAGFASVLTVARAGWRRGMPCGQPAVNCC